MISRTIGIAAIVLIALGCSSSKTHRRAALENLEGNWTCTSAVINGKPLPDKTVEALRLTLTRERYTTRRGSEVLFDSTYTTEATKNPKQIDMVGTEGDLKGRNAEGIYSLAGNTLTICYSMPGKQRPVNFESNPGSEAYLVTWKRERP